MNTSDLVLEVCVSLSLCVCVCVCVCVCLLCVLKGTSRESELHIFYSYSTV